jgi:uncharacterized membrane protein (UPF0127 family)
MENRQSIDIDGLEIADTPWTRAAGLMFRKEPSPLLIVFDREARHAIWMLCMRFPIDLVFLDADRTVVTVHENIPPVSLAPATWRIYRPKKRAKYALETPAGWAKEKAIATGDTLNFRL